MVAIPPNAPFGLLGPATALGPDILLDERRAIADIGRRRDEMGLALTV